MNIQDYIPINWGLAANPYNWIIVVLMVMVGGLALSLLFPKVSPNTTGA